MMTRDSYWQPPYTPSPELDQLIAKIDLIVASMAAQTSKEHCPRLERTNIVRTVQSSLTIDGIKLNAPEVTVILDGKTPVASSHDIQAARNALKCYNEILDWNPLEESHFQEVHSILMDKLIQECGGYRQASVLPKVSFQLVHQPAAPEQIPSLMAMLFDYLKHDKAHYLVKAIAFQFQVNAIQPFADGNARMARLWRSLICQTSKPYFAYLPIDSVSAKEKKKINTIFQRCMLYKEMAPFIQIMLELILEAIALFAPLIARHVHIPQPQMLPIETSTLLRHLTQECSCKELSTAMGIDDVEVFYRKYVAPAMAQSFVELSNPNETELSKRKLVLTELGYEWHFINAR